MAEIIEDPDRQVVPRWRVFSAAAKFGELSPLKIRNPEAFTDEMLVPVLEDWKREPGLSVAADVVSAAPAIGRTGAATEAANFILATENAPPLARELALRCIGQGSFAPSATTAAVGGDRLDDESSFRSAAHQNRDRLNAFPINPVLWTNQAFLFTTLGQCEGRACHAYSPGFSPDQSICCSRGVPPFPAQWRFGTRTFDTPAHGRTSS